MQTRGGPRHQRGLPDPGWGAEGWLHDQGHPAQPLVPTERKVQPASQGLRRGLRTGQGQAYRGCCSAGPGQQGALMHQEQGPDWVAFISHLCALASDCQVANRMLATMLVATKFSLRGVCAKDPCACKRKSRFLPTLPFLPHPWVLPGSRAQPWPLCPWTALEWPLCLREGQGCSPGSEPWTVCWPLSSPSTRLWPHCTPHRILEQS